MGGIAVFRGVNGRTQFPRDWPRPIGLQAMGAEPLWKTAQRDGGKATGVGEKLIPKDW